jgi:photosystem II stability/assembly factor-like uncharacterized protein
MSTPGALHVATQSGWYRFEPRGDEWVAVERALTYWGATCLAVDPVDRRIVYVGTEHSGVFASIDGGATWRRADPNVPRLSTFAMLALPGQLLVGTVPAELYAREADGWRERDDVRRGVGAALFPPNPDLGSRTRYLAVDPSVPERVYCAIEVGGLLGSDDGGRTWHTTDEGLGDPDVHQVWPCLAEPELVLAACGESIYRSKDRGAHWEETTPPGGRTYGMAVAEDGAGALYVGLARNRPNTWLGPARADGAILRSRDGGTRWEPVVEGLRGGVMDLCTAPDGRGILAATSEGDVLAIGESGIRTVASGLPCITAMAIGD